MPAKHTQQQQKSTLSLPTAVNALGSSPRKKKSVWLYRQTKHQKKEREKVPSINGCWGIDASKN